MIYNCIAARNNFVTHDRSMTSDRLVTYDRSKLAILIGLNINIIKYTFPIFFSNLSENVTRGSFVTWQSFHDSVQFRDLTKLFRDS